MVRSLSCETYNDDAQRCEYERRYEEDDDRKSGDVIPVVTVAVDLSAKVGNVV